MSHVPNRRGTVNTNFRVMNGNWREYAQQKQEWIKAHPKATSREIDVAARAIAKRLGL